MQPTKEKWYDKGMKYCIYALPIIIPAVFSPAFYTVFSAPKLLTLRLLTLLIMVFWGAKVFIEGKFSYKKGPLNILLLTYAIVTILSVIFSTAFYTSLYGTQGRFLGIFTILNLLLLPLFIWNFLTQKKELITLLKISVVTSIILALYGIAQFFGIFQEGFNWDQVPSARIFGTVGHGNHFGAYLGMTLILGLFLIPTFKKRWQKVLIAAGATIQISTLLLTASRGALAATIIAAAISLVILSIKKWETTKKYAAKLLLPTFLIISITVTAAIVLGRDFRKIPLIDRTIVTITNVQEGNIPDRFSWWLSSIEMIKDRPLLGFGLSTFRDTYNMYRRVDFKTVEEGDMQNHITPEAAHNEYLNMAATQGLIGLAAFLALVFYVLFKKQEDDELFYTNIGIKCAMVVYLLQIVISFGVITTLTMFFLLLGAQVALADKSRSKKVVNLSGITKYVLVIFILTGINFATLGTFSEAAAEIYYKNGLTEAVNGNIEKATLEFEKMVKAKPFEYSYHQIFADIVLKYSRQEGIDDALKINLIKMAILNYENVLIINDLHPSTYYNLGIAYLQIYAYTGNDTFYQNAELNLIQSIEKAVNNPLYPYQVGRAYMALEEPEAYGKAIDAFGQALQISPGFRDAELIIKQLEPLAGNTTPDTKDTAIPEAQPQPQTGR